jgi:electron transport complex protein RnfD
MQIKPQRSKMLDVLLALLPLVVISIYFYGFRALIITLTTVLVADLFDYACVRALKLRHRAKGDISWLITGLIFSLSMSAAIPYWICIYGMLFAIMVAKAPFGGYGKNIFNPAAAGIAFVAISFQANMFVYPQPYLKLPLDIDLDLTQIALENTPAFSLNAGGAPVMRQLDVLLSNYSGPMGATALLVIVACAVFLLFRRSASLQIIISSVAALSVIAFLFPRTEGSRIFSVGYELLAGIFLFAVVFMASDPVTTPKTGFGKILFGLWLGVGTMMVRYFGYIELAVVFPLLIGNALVPRFDLLAHRLYKKRHASQLPPTDEVITVEVDASKIPEEMREVTEND